MLGVVLGSNNGGAPSALNLFSVEPLEEHEDSGHHIRRGRDFQRRRFFISSLGQEAESNIFVLEECGEPIPTNGECYGMRQEGKRGRTYVMKEVRASVCRPISSSALSR